MRVALHDSDAKKYPNFALMKISAYHKKVGDSVEWWLPLEHYRDFTNNIEPTIEQRHFARWVNRKAIFKTVNRFADYAP